MTFRTPCQIIWQQISFTRLHSLFGGIENHVILNSLRLQEPTCRISMKLNEVKKKILMLSYFKPSESRPESLQ